MTARTAIAPASPRLLRMGGEGIWGRVRGPGHMGHLLCMGSGTLFYLMPMEALRLSIVGANRLSPPSVSWQPTPTNPTTCQSWAQIGCRRRRLRCDLGCAGATERQGRSRSICLACIIPVKYLCPTGRVSQKQIRPRLPVRSSLHLAMLSRSRSSLGRP